MGISGSRILFIISASMLVCLLAACGPDKSESTSGSPPKTAAPAPSTKPTLAVRSDYYTAEVEAELKASGLKASDFRKGQKLYELYCMNCHAKPKRGGGPDPSKRLAPPAFAVADHYRRAIPDASERVEAIARFTAKPSKEDALMPGAVEKFGLMAPMPLAEEQLHQTSVFLGTAEFEKPGWYDQHYKEEHGE
ncbi:MAG: c-type cytochrome [Opitutales bacterium]